MTVTPIGPYVPGNFPIPTVQPFTYRDGVTYWEKLNGIIRYLNRTIIPYIDTNISTITTEFTNEVNTLISQVNDALSANETEIDGKITDLEAQFNTVVQQIINDSVEVQDPVVAGIINDTGSESRVALDAIIPGDPEISDFVSDADSETRSAINALIPGDMQFADILNDQNSDSFASIDAVFSRQSGVPKLAFNRKKKAVFFGDSWTTIFSGQLVSRVSSFLNIESTNYGISNSAFNSGPVTIESQVVTASNDATVDKTLVEYVIVICGTNNVFWAREFTFGGVSAFFNSVRTLYPNAEIYFIPENANDYNGGLTYQYNTMMLGAQYAGVKVADWALWLNWYNFGAFYQGTDDNGRQHLTASGYDQFGSWIASWIKGTDLANLGMKVKFSPTIDDANTSLTFTAGHSLVDSYNDRSYIKNGIVVMDIELTNLMYKSGQTVPSLRFLGSLEPWSPINQNAGGSNVVGSGYAGSAYHVSTNMVPNSTNGYTLFTAWHGSGNFTNVRLRTDYNLLGALP